MKKEKLHDIYPFKLSIAKISKTTAYFIITFVTLITIDFFRFDIKLFFFGDESFPDSIFHHLLNNFRSLYILYFLTLIYFFIFNYLTNKEEKEQISNIPSATNKYEFSPYYNELNIYINLIIDRINSEITTLRKKADSNLAIALTSTMSVIIYLVIDSDIKSMLNFEAVPTEWKVFLFSYIPKLSIVVVIELFAFHFLSLYRANLAEIKYYQNELTDIEIKMLAFRYALMSGDKESSQSVATQLLTLRDRNRILKSDELTEDLLKNKLENELMKKFIDKIPDMNQFKGVFKSEDENKNEKSESTPSTSKETNNEAKK